MDVERARRAGAILAVALFIALAVGGVVLAVSFLSDPATVEGTLDIQATDGPNVTIDASQETLANLDDTFATAYDIFLQTEHGEIGIDGDDGVEATIDVTNIEGTQTTATGLSGGNDWLFLDPGDKQRLGIRGDVDAVQFRAVGVDDGTVDIEIVGTASGSAELHIEDLPTSTDIALYDPNSDEVLAHGTTDGSGTLVESLELQATNQQLEVRTVASFTEPALSNPQPEGQVEGLPDELSVDLEAEAWPVEVEFELDGDIVGTETATANGTVSTNVDVTELGSYEWNATATDAAGRTDTIETSFQTPEELTIREEHDPETVIDDATVNLRFFTVGGDIAIREETSDGTVDMTGLPDDEFVVFVQAEGYYDRRVYIESIFEQEDLFLLNSTEFTQAENDAIVSRFVFTDLTGQFPRSDTTIQVQRALDLDGDGTSEWTTIAGDFWGAGGEFEVVLERGERYRLFVRNTETGETDVVGTHIPTEDLTQEIRMSGLTQEAANATGVYANAALNASDGTIELIYSDPTEETTELHVRIVSSDGEQTIYDETITGPLGTYRDVVALDADNITIEDDTWVVEFESDRHTSSVPLGSGVVETPVDVPGWIMGLLMAMAVTFVGALYGPRTALLGAWAMIFVAAGAAMFGWGFSWVPVIVATVAVAGATFYSEIL